MSKKLYIIPGFGEKCSDEPYRTIINNADLLGLKTIPINLTWSHSTATDWLNEAKSALRDSDSNSIVLGFSFGAYIAALVSRSTEQKKLILCSISPYFKDNLANIPALAAKELGRRRMNDFMNHEFPTNTIDKEAIFMVGEEEIPLELKHVRSRFEAWQGKKKIIIVPGAQHDLSSGKYTDMVIEEIKNPD